MTLAEVGQNDRFVNKFGMPTANDLVWPTLQVLKARNSPVSIQELAEGIASVLKLPREVVETLHLNGPSTKVEYRSAWARTYLKWINAIRNTSRGKWAITDKGRAINSEEEVRRLIKEYWTQRTNKVKPSENDEAVSEKEAELPGVESHEAYTIEEAHQDLFIPLDDFKRLLNSIKSRKNLILQGPPGTGKTFIARRIAWCLIGRKDNSPIEMVQFHQSYAYEDFVQGYRPTKDGGFELKNGVFHQFCEKARSNPSTPHVFIIDEINRGNLSRIFGELLMLIEHDKRNKNFAVALTYSDGRFHVPKNVYILGMMNTADRSLALVDYALRRRFAFESLEPAYRTDYGRVAFEKHLTKRGANSDLARNISDRMAKLNKAIREDQELGPGFQIGHSYFVPVDGEELSKDWYKNVVETQIAPLLREYWFDSREDVDKKVGKLTTNA